MPRACLQRLAPALVLALLVAVFFWDALLLGRAPLMRDTFCSFVPWRQFAAGALADGVIPLWNPFSKLGQPFVANPQSAVFYPGHLPFYLLPTGAALIVSLLGHVWIAATSTYLLARSWGQSRVPALLSASTFAFGTYFIANLEFQSVLTTLAWFPLALWLATRATDELEEPTAMRARAAGAAPFLLGLALVLAVQFLAGNIQPLLYTGLLLALYVIVRSALQRGVRGLGVAACAFAPVAVLALALTAVQFLTTYELIPHSIRAGGISAETEISSLHPRHLGTLVLPFIYGAPGRFGQWWGAHQLWEYWLGACHVGIVALVLASCATALRGTARQRLHTAFCMGGAVFALLLAFGELTPVYGIVQSVVPGFEMVRWPAKALQMFALCLALLAGFGFDRLLARREEDRFPLLVRIGLATVLLLVLLLGSAGAAGDASWVTRWTGETPSLSPAQLAQQLADCRAGAVFLALGIGALVCWRSRRAVPAWAPVAVLVLVFANSLYVSRQIHAFADVGVYTDVPTEMVERTRAAAVGERGPGGGEDPGGRIDGGRVHNGTYEMAQLHLYGLRDPDLFRWAKTVSVGETGLPHRIARAHGGGTLDEARSRALTQDFVESQNRDADRIGDVIGIRWVLTGPPLQAVLSGTVPIPQAVWVERQPLPRARFAREVVEMPDEQARVEVGSPPVATGQRVLVAPGAGVQLPSGGSGEILSITDGWDELRIEVRADRPATLVVADTWLPGWSATVDGAPTPVLRANYALRAVAVPAGAHNVVMTYAAPGFRTGAWISLIALAAWTALAFVTWRLHRRRREDPVDAPSPSDPSPAAASSADAARSAAPQVAPDA